MKSLTDPFYFSPDRLRTFSSSSLPKHFAGGSFNPNRTSANVDLKENQQSPGLFSRDLLLFKCKATIEELQTELEAMSKSKITLEEKCSRFEKDLQEKSDQLSQERFLKEKIERRGFLLEVVTAFIEELKENRLSFMALNEKSMYMEDKMRLLKDAESRNEEMKKSFQQVVEENDDLKAFIDELQKDLKNKEDLAREWQDVLENIKKKIFGLEEENQGWD